MLATLAVCVSARAKFLHRTRKHKESCFVYRTGHRRGSGYSYEVRK